MDVKNIGGGDREFVLVFFFLIRSNIICKKTFGGGDCTLGNCTR